MSNDLQKKIESLVSINSWKFDGLPEAIQNKLDELIQMHNCNELLSAMYSLVAKFEIEEKELSETRGNSGLAGEMYMASGMRTKYLNESIAYTKSKLSKTT